jgi:hypothetical protein
LAHILKTVHVTGPAGTLIINERDLAAFRAQGYDLAAGPIPATEPPASVPVPEPAEAELTVAEMRGKAASLGVINAGKLKERDLRDAIAACEAEQ